MNEKTKNRLKGLAKTMFAVGFPIFCSLTKEPSSTFNDLIKPTYVLCGLLLPFTVGDMVTGQDYYLASKLGSETRIISSKINCYFNERRNIKYLL